MTPVLSVKGEESISKCCVKNVPCGGTDVDRWRKTKMGKELASCLGWFLEAWSEQCLDLLKNLTIIHLLNQINYLFFC